MLNTWFVQRRGNSFVILLQEKHHESSAAQLDDPGLLPVAPCGEATGCWTGGARLDAAVWRSSLPHTHKCAHTHTHGAKRTLILEINDEIWTCQPGGTHYWFWLKGVITAFQEVVVPRAPRSGPVALWIMDIDQVLLLSCLIFGEHLNWAILFKKKRTKKKPRRNTKRILKVPPICFKGNLCYYLVDCIVNFIDLTCKNLLGCGHCCSAVVIFCMCNIYHMHILTCRIYFFWWIAWVRTKWGDKLYWRCENHQIAFFPLSLQK